MHHYVILYDDIHIYILYDIWYVYTNCMLCLRVSKHVLSDWWNCTCFILSDEWHIFGWQNWWQTRGLWILVQLGTDCMLHPCLTVASLVHIEIYWNISKQDNEPEITSGSEFRHLKHLGFHVFPFLIGNESLVLAMSQPFIFNICPLVYQNDFRYWSHTGTIQLSEPFILGGSFVSALGMCCEHSSNGTRTHKVGPETLGWFA